MATNNDSDKLSIWLTNSLTFAWHIHQLIVHKVGFPLDSVDALMQNLLGSHQVSSFQVLKVCDKEKKIYP